MKEAGRSAIIQLLVFFMSTCKEHPSWTRLNSHQQYVRYQSYNLR